MPGSIALGDEPPLVDHDERRGERRRRIERGRHCGIQLRLVDLRRQRRLRQPVAHRPVLRRRIGQRRLHGHGREGHILRAARQRDATLIADEPGAARDAVRQRQPHLMRVAVDDGVDDLGAAGARRYEEPVLVHGGLEVASGDEDRRAQDLRKPGRLMLEPIARRHFPCRRQFRRRGRVHRLSGRQRNTHRYETECAASKLQHYLASFDKLRMREEFSWHEERPSS